MFLDDLPPVEELASIALTDVWMPAFEMLRDLDGRDTIELAGQPR